MVGFFIYSSPMKGVMLTAALKKHIKMLLIAAIAGTLIAAAPSISGAKESELEIPVFQKGMCYATWDNSFGGSESERSIKELKDHGVEYVQIVITLYQDRRDTTEIFYTNKTSTDRDVIQTIKDAHEAGLKVMLKPHIDIIDTEKENYWRGDIGFYDPASWDEWFANYQKMILNYAKLAEENNVEILCVGTELTFASQKTEHWRSMIRSVREIYNGPLIYAANWDDYKDVKFWDALDMAGIDAYFPLSNRDNASIEEIRAGWTKWKSEIEKWQSRINKPVVFTEIGYPSSVHAPREPWASGRGNAKPELQAACYSAFFEEVSDSPWLAGTYWWHWSPHRHDGGRGDNHFSPRNKPAMQVLTEHYERIGTRELIPLGAPSLDSDLALLDSMIAKEILPFYMDNTGNFVGFEVYNLSPPMFSEVMTKLQGAFDRLEASETITMPKGERYMGELMSEIPHGKGIIVYKNGDKYAGAFRNGLREGRGIFLWQNGNIYMGEYKGGAKSGKGTFFWKNGNVYSGDFEYDIPQGKGMERRKDEFTYEGEFKGGYPHGKGVMIKSSGSRYEGEFKAGLPHGRGVLHKKNGQVLEGFFRDGHYAGKQAPDLI